MLLWRRYVVLTLPFLLLLQQGCVSPNPSGTTHGTSTSAAATPRAYNPPIEIPVTPQTPLIGKVITVPTWSPHPCEVVSVKFQTGYGTIVPPKLTGKCTNVQDGSDHTYYVEPGDGSRIIADSRGAYAAVAPKYKQLELTDLLRSEEKQVRALKVPPSQRIATEKFVLKVQRIFDSMHDYHTSTLGTHYSGGILRKDIDRYDDAIVDAKGKVPDGVISYVEETYHVFLASLGSLDSDVGKMAIAKRNAMMLLAK